MRDQGQIVLCDPLCHGFEHVMFNSALAATVLCAWPHSRLEFLGEEAHLAMVSDRLTQWDAGQAGRVSWTPQVIAPRHQNNLKRLNAEWRIISAAIGSAVRNRAPAIVFCSATNITLGCLKILLAVRPAPPPTGVVVHGDLTSINAPPPNVVSHILRLKNMLALPQPAKLKLIVLGESIRENLLELLPGQAGRWSSLDHPLLSSQEVSAPELEAPREVRFGFIGTTRKNFDLFVRLAAAVGAVYPQAVFELVGHADVPVPPGAERYVERIEKKPISLADFTQRMRRLTYSVFLGDPRHYHLAASGAFVDSVAYGKPLLALSNPFLQHYASVFGDIGYFCNDFEELVNAATGILRQFALARYNSQVHNMLRLKDHLCPERLSRRLREILSL